MKIISAVFLVLSLYLVQGQLIARQKCTEYRNLTRKKVTILNLTVHGTLETLETSNCSSTVDLIAGGKNAQPGEFPHQALLGNRDDPSKYDFFCGGSLISEKFVLTAAHCLNSGCPKIVRLGAHNLADEYDDSVDYEVARCVRHPNHTFKKSYHDIALVELKETVQFSKFVRPACLWTELEIRNSFVIATGFGFTEHAGDYSDVLQKVSLTILSKDDCRAQFLSNPGKFTPKLGITGGQLCIGSRLEEGKDTCTGDSGGPVQVLTEAKGCTYYVLGITSTGAACGIGKSKAIYTFVAPYVRWIEQTVWG